MRPSIIGASHVDPVPGWTDTLSAAGGLIFLNGTGLKHAYPMRFETIIDIVPVDYVINSALVASFFTAIKPKTEVEIYTVASSDLNPLFMGQVITDGKFIYDQVELAKKVNAIWLTSVNDPRLYKLFSLIAELAPIYLLKVFAIISKDQKLRKIS